jgi:mannose-6-phosphate isomerase-like protein (cupin superfamily)
LAASTSDGRTALNSASKDPIWAAFDISQLIAQRAGQAQPWLPFLQVSTLTAGLYVLPEGGVDYQEPHDQDEVYYIVSGRATIEVEGENREVRPGSVIYVKAQAAHRFLDIEEELRVLVLFSAAEPS